MKTMILIGAVFMGLLFAVPAIANTDRATGTTCTYKSRLGFLYVRLSGSDNIPYYCRAFNGTTATNGFHGIPFYGVIPGRVACAWVSNDLDIRLTVFSTTVSYGRTFCRIFSAKVGSGFFRVR